MFNDSTEQIKENFKQAELIFQNVFAYLFKIVYQKLQKRYSIQNKFFIKNYNVFKEIETFGTIPNKSFK